ncbi:MAG: alpha/beta hydrolase [Leptolyngbya sp. Prado105]|jgi:predicted dienelactone hydrolase|nr:alpha/beta hydrolase [Leptolyngbya sp. Prado105]
MQLSKLTKLAFQTISGLTAALALSRPAWSADRIVLSYGILERSVSVSALEAYARQGVLDSDLYVYSQYVDAAQLATLRKALLARADLSPVAVSQFLYTQQGEILLRRLGEVIQPESRDTGFFAIRAALILASAEPEGLTLLNVFRKFPTRGIRIDLQRSLQIANDFGDLIGRTRQATDLVAQIASQEVTPLPGGTIPDLTARGAYGFQRNSLRFVDRSRGFVQALGRERVFPVDVYLPIARRQALPRLIPVVVISHGLGSDRGTFRYLAEHLASHGFAVAIPEHPGSNAKQLQALVDGTANEVTSPSEFIDRPLDIRFVLDELERKTTSNPQYSRLNVKQVGVLGQSFGGYTAMALAGAPINFTQLQQSCRPEAVDRTLNLSLLLQCRAAALPAINYNLGDPRVKAIIAINPISSSVFGQASVSQIRTPTMILAGNADTIAPALPEQIQPFTWLQTNDRYLGVIEQGTHFSNLGQGNDEGVPVPPEVIGPNPAIARRYTNALSLAFFQTYINNQANYRPYISATYARAISQDPLRLSLVQSLTISQLDR